MKAFVSCT